MTTFILFLLVFVLGLRIGYSWGTAVTLEWLKWNYPRWFTLKKGKFLDAGVKVNEYRN